MQFVDFDAAYLVRLQSRDPDTERHFVGYFSELIRLKLRRRLNSREGVEDARQETFARVLKLVRADGLREPERLGALVNSVCNNVLLEQYRAKGKQDSSLEDAEPGSFIDPEPGPEQRLAAGDTQRTVQRILRELPERDRQLLQSVLLEDRDRDAICGEYGVTREHLRVLVHRAKQTFKAFYLKHLGEYGAQE